MSRRDIHKTRRSVRNAVREVMEFAMVSEFLDPSDCLWVVSPWINDVPVLDNTTGEFTSLCPDLPRADIGLVRVLRELILRGSYVVLATRPGADQFVGALRAG